MTGSVSVNENGDRNEDYAVYDFRANGTRGKFIEVGRYYGFEQEYVQTGKVRKLEWCMAQFPEIPVTVISNF